MKFPKVIIPILAIGAIGVASLAAPPFSSIEKTPEVKGSVFFSMKSTPNGFSLTPGYNNSDLPELTGKQNPNPITNQAGTCKFSPQVSYLSADYAGRGDKYLSLSYIYDNAQASPHLPSAIKKEHVTAGDTNLEMLTSSYDVPPAKGNSEKGYYRTVAVRAIDKTVPVPYVAGSESKGIPVVVMTYDCQNVSDYKNSDFSALLAAVNVNLTDTVSNNAPVKDTVKPTQSANPTPAPAATAEDGSTAPESPSDSPSASTANSSTSSPNTTAGAKSSPATSATPSK